MIKRQRLLGRNPFEKGFLPKPLPKTFNILTKRMIMAIKTIWLSGLLYILLCWLPGPAHPEIIWQVGNINGQCEEFIFSEKRVIDYQVPPDWETRLNQEHPDWGEFPSALYPVDDQANNTQEIRINFDYQARYSNPVLRITASILSRQASLYLEVFKDKTHIGQILVEMPYYNSFDFPLGEIKKGLSGENTIVIRNIPGDSLSTSLPIIFDAIYLVDNNDSHGNGDGDEIRDSDEDGISDFDEGDEDWDKDGLADKMDQDTACLTIKSDDQSVSKKIRLQASIHVEGEEGRDDEMMAGLSFREVRFLDPNLLDRKDVKPLDQLRANRFLPYGFCAFRIEGLSPRGNVLLQLGYPKIDTIYPSLQLYTYRNLSTWQEIALEGIDQENKIISLILKDGEPDDLDGEENGSITVYLALSYPRSLGVKIEKGGCFLGETQHSSFSLIIGYMVYYIMQLTTAAPVYAEFADMKMNATPNPIGSGARAMGIGGAFISIADDATAASWNPAGLLQLTKPEISIVGSWFSGNIDYQTSDLGGTGEIDDCSPSINRLNYLSAVIPFILLRRNMVFSLNYQHLYEFSKDDLYTYTLKNEAYGIDMVKKAHKMQRGSLSTISPAMAFQITPSFFAGLTANFWPNKIIDNGWENLNQTTGEGIERQREAKSYAELYERYDFSGFNMHLGFLFISDYHILWGGRRRFRLGGVIKTPFKADIRHEQRELSYIEYPKNPVMNDPIPPPPEIENLTLRMPLSYGLGTSFDFSDSFSIALDLYRTHWEQYLIKYPTNNTWSPFTNTTKAEADINPTTQLRFGTEYLIQKPGRIIPIRAGIFYDPEPASHHPDDFYGISFGTGISYKELFSLDFVYQYRFGEKGEAESMQTQSISCKVTQHYFYASIIYYLF